MLSSFVVFLNCMGGSYNEKVASKLNQGAGGVLVKAAVVESGYGYNVPLHEREHRFLHPVVERLEVGRDVRFVNRSAPLPAALPRLPPLHGPSFR